MSRHHTFRTSHLLSTSRSAGTTRTTRGVRRVALPVIAFAGGVGALVVTSSLAAAAPSPLSCGAVVTTDVLLTTDLVDCPGSGLIIGAPGITIDLGGRVIDGTGSGAGIDNEAGHDDVRIRRGTLREFVFGVILFQADGARLERLTAVANLDGATIASSTDVELDRMTAIGNVGPGIDITFSDQVTVRRSVAADNGFGGIVDRFSDHSRHVENTLTGNVASGLILDSTIGAVVERNHLAANDANGIDLIAVDDAVVARNEVVANSGDGIFIDGPGNLVRGNRTNGNRGAGIAAPDGTIDGGGNRARGNLAGDCIGVVCR